MRYIHLLLGVLISEVTQAAHTYLRLQQALDKKLVETQVISRGGHGGFCIQMNLNNKTPDSLVILVEAGRRLNSLDDHDQDILVVKEERVALRAMERKSLGIKGYCCQATNSSPSRGAKYHVNVMSDSTLARLARLLNFKTFDPLAEQQAVWAISNDRSAATISGGKDSLTRFLREAVAAFKGEELPWYVVLSKEYISRDGLISLVNQRLQGAMNYANEKEGYATLLVKNKQGDLVCQIKSEWLKATSSSIYTIDLPIKGLDKGSYTIELKTQEKQLAKRVFEL